MEEAQIGRTDPSNPVATLPLRLNTQTGVGYSTGLLPGTALTTSVNKSSNGIRVDNQ
jgi:hypothetical protein